MYTSCIKLWDHDQSWHKAQRTCHRMFTSKDFKGSMLRIRTSPLCQLGLLQNSLWCLVWLRGIWTMLNNVLIPLVPCTRHATLFQNQDLAYTGCSAGQHIGMAMELIEMPDSQMNWNFWHQSEKHNLYIKKHRKPHFAKRTMTSVHLDSWKSQDPVRHNWTTCFIIFILFESFWHNTRWRFCLFSEIYGMSQHDLPHIGGSCLRHVGHSIFTSIHLRNHAIRIRLALCLKDSQGVLTK